MFFGFAVRECALVDFRIAALFTDKEVALVQERQFIIVACNNLNGRIPDLIPVRYSSLTSSDISAFSAIGPFGLFQSRLADWPSYRW